MISMGAAKDRMMGKLTNTERYAIWLANQPLRMGMIVKDIENRELEKLLGVKEATR